MYNLVNLNSGKTQIQLKTILPKYKTNFEVFLYNFGLLKNDFGLL